MNQNMRKLFSAAAAFALLTVGCGTQDSTPAADQSADSAVQTDSQDEDKQKSQIPAEVQNIPAVLLPQETPAYTSAIADIFTDRDMRDTYDEPLADITCRGDTVSIAGSGASANGSDITITEEGVYRITGTLNDGQILVNSAGKVQLVLDGVSLSCSDSAAIYVQQAKKCFITLAEGTENSVSDGTTYVYAQEGDNEPDAAIFSADTLTVNGSGSLTVSGNYNEGIACKDELVITNGTISITSVGNGIKGKDYVAVAGGDITITAGADGLKSNNAADAGCGFIYVQDGNLTIDAQEDGIQAETEFIAAGGTISVTSGGGSANAQPQMQNDFGGGHGGFGGFGNWGDYDETETADDTAVSTKAVKSGTLLYITGGEFTLDTADDGLHSNGDIVICGGTAEITAGGDGVHADGLADFTDGTVRVLKSGEGIEAAGIRISGGTVEATSSDDGFNASDGTSQGAMGTYSDGAALEISGGSVYVNADGDGLDSNGDMLISGGTVIVDGPANSGNGALDGNGGMYCTGGLLIAAGNSGMAEYPQGSQNTAIITLGSSCQGGTSVTICDSSGTEILGHTPAKMFNSFIVSSPALRDGETYTVSTDGTEAGSFTVESVLSYVGETDGMMGGGFQQGGWGGGRGDMGGGRGDMGGGRGDMGGGRGGRQDMEMPTDEKGSIAMPEGMEPPQGRFPDGGRGGFPDGMQPPQGMQES